MKTKIELNGMEFYSYHGCLPEERRDGNVFSVDLCCEYDFSTASESDRIEDTLDYSVLYDIVAEQMARPSDLLENVAARILKAVHDACPVAGRTRVRVAKKNPPLAGKVAWSAVVIEDEG